jgi:2-methylaconitate cis-trans-isomerase PrpF
MLFFSSRWEVPILAADSSTAEAADSRGRRRLRRSSVRACDDADLDYTFAQVAMKEASVDYNCNCGDMSSAVGSFAVDEQIVSIRVDDVTLRIFDTKTRKLFSPLSACRGGGRALSEGKLQIPGISGTGAPIRPSAPNCES